MIKCNRNIVSFIITPLPLQKLLQFQALLRSASLEILLALWLVTQDQRAIFIPKLCILHLNR